MVFLPVRVAILCQKPFVPSQRGQKNILAIFRKDEDKEIKVILLIGELVEHLIFLMATLVSALVG